MDISVLDARGEIGRFRVKNHATCLSTNPERNVLRIGCLCHLALVLHTNPMLWAQLDFCIGVELGG